MNWMNVGKKWISAVLLALFLCTYTAAAPPENPPAPRSAIETQEEQQEELLEEAPQPDYKALREEVLALINAEREAQGAPLLKLEKEINAAAQIRAEEMDRRFSHTRPNEEKWSTVLEECGVKGKTRAENIAIGHEDPESVVVAWMDSSGHRRSILDDDYTRTGIGVFLTEEGDLAWVQLFLA